MSGTVETLTKVAAADGGAVVTELAVTYFNPEDQARAAQIVLVLGDLAMADASVLAQVAELAAKGARAANLGLVGGKGLGAPEGAGPVVGQSGQEFFKAEAEACGFTSAIGLDGSIDPAVWSANADGRGLPATRVRVEGGLNRGQHKLVVGGYGYTFDELRLHGILSESDVQILGYAMNCLMGAAGSAERVGCKGYVLAFHGEGAEAVVCHTWGQLLRTLRAGLGADAEWWPEMVGRLTDPDEWVIDESGRPFYFSEETGEGCSVSITRLSRNPWVIL